MDKSSVLIVGAGPTGLVLALALSKQGIPVRLIDKANKPGEQSRAIAVHARTLEFYRQLNIHQDLLAAGIIVDNILIRKNGKPKAKVNLAKMGETLSYFPFLFFIPQDEHEKILIQHLKKYGVEIEWNTELIACHQEENPIKVILRKNEQQEVTTFPYVCGCDGAHSSVRKLIKQKFKGGTYHQVFYVADVTTPTPLQYLGLNISKKDIHILMPVRKNNSLRIIGIVEETFENKTDSIEVQLQLLRKTGLTIDRINWFSIYKIHHRMVAHFNKGNVFLLGDAAHIHSPAGGQGMNTGIGDAINLAWKLAQVIDGKASETILKSYDEERAPFARKLLASTDKAFQLMSGQKLFNRFFRFYIFPLILNFMQYSNYFLRKFFRLVSQIRINYRQSSLSKNNIGNAQGGERLPWIKLPAGDNYETFNNILCWQCHVYGEVRDEVINFCNQKALPLFNFPWQDAMKKPGLIKDALYLIRPDLHVALVIKQNQLPTLERYIKEFNLSFGIKKVMQTWHGIAASE